MCWHDGSGTRLGIERWRASRAGGAERNRVARWSAARLVPSSPS